jgi:3-isopropylmalate dehydrogenase
MERRYAIVPGDGIGIDVSREAVSVLEAAARAFGFTLRLESFDYGAERYLRTGETLPDGALETWSGFDAIFMGAFGDPRVPDMRHAADILLGTRFRMDLYANLRPVRCLAERLCPLRAYHAPDVDFVVFRENTEGAYAGMGGIFKKGTHDEIGIQEDVNTYKGVERIVRAAFDYAKANGKTKVTMSDKSNALRHAHDIWQRVFAAVAAGYPGIRANHLYVDALAMQMIKDPTQFEVIVTCNMFGDIVTDLGATLQGGLGMAASGNLHPGRTSMFEPVHGSAPKYAGLDTANPFGAILTAAMMLEHTGLPEPAHAIEAAVVADVGGASGTRAASQAVVRRVLVAA